MDRTIAALLLALFFLQSHLGIRSESMTFDEGTAIGSSFLAFRKGDVSLAHERPPLLGLFTTLPLVLSGDVKLPKIGDAEERTADVAFGDALMHEAGNDTIRILKVCRYTVLLLSLLLGFLIYRWSRRLGGRWAGFLALSLFAFCPNLLAHSRIAANDMMSTIFVFVALEALDRFLTKPGKWCGVWAGAALGFALSAKLSSWVIVPVYLAALAYELREWRERKPEALQWLKRFGVLFFVAVVGIGATMGGMFDYATYCAGFGKIYQGTNAVYPWYLGGDVSFSPWWYYHLYALFIKTPIPLLLLFLLGVTVLFRDRSRWKTAAIVLSPAALFLAASCFDRTNLGVRRVLPVYPFLILAASQAVTVPLERIAKIVLFAFLGLWQVVSVGRVVPHHLSYFNEWIGGPGNGIRFLDDSNIDWGQDLPSLKRWLDAHPGLDVRLGYFGMARPATYGISLPSMVDQEEVCAPRKTAYAVSAHRLAFFEKVARTRGATCSWLTRYTPVDRVAYSIYIYDFRDKL